MSVADLLDRSYTSAFSFAVAESMSISPAYVTYHSFTTLPLRRRLLSSYFDLIFLVSIPTAEINSTTSSVNASAIQLGLQSTLFDAIESGAALNYIVSKLSEGGFPASLKIAPIGFTFTVSPSVAPTAAPLVPSAAEPISPTTFLVVVSLGSFFVISVGIAAFVLYRRFSVKSSVAKKYKPVSNSAAVDEEMSMDSIYTSPRTRGEDGSAFQLDVSNLLALRNGEEHKGSDGHSPDAAATNSFQITVKKEAMLDLSTMEAYDSADLSFGGASGAMSSFLDGSWLKKKERRPNEEADISLDSLYPGDKPISFSHPESGKRRSDGEKVHVNFHDVYPDGDLIQNMKSPLPKSSITTAASILQGRFDTPKARKFGSKLVVSDDKANVSGFNPMRRTPNNNKNSDSAIKTTNLLPNFQREQIGKSFDSNNTYRDKIIESRKQLRRLDPAAQSNPLSYSAGRFNAMKTNAARFADPVLSSSSGGIKRNGSVTFDPPLRHEIPIVEVFKSVNVTQMSGLSPGIKFRLSKLKFEARSGER